MKKILELVVTAADLLVIHGIIVFRNVHVVPWTFCLCIRDRLALVVEYSLRRRGAYLLNFLYGKEKIGDEDD